MAKSVLHLCTVSKRSPRELAMGMAARRFTRDELLPTGDSDGQQVCGLGPVSTIGAALQKLVMMSELGLGSLSTSRRMLSLLTRKPQPSSTWGRRVLDS